MIRMVQIGIDHPHAAAYRRTLGLLSDRIDVVGFVRGATDPAATDLEAFKDRPVFDTIAEMLESVHPDAAQVMLRNNDMGPALATLAEAGVHLWAEKPVARRASELAPVRDAIRRKQLVFTSGYQSRFYPTTQYVRSLITENMLGALTFAHMTTATTTALLRNPDGPTSYLFDETVSGGGILHWLGCHMVDLLLHVSAGQPRSVQAMTAVSGEADISVEDVAAVTIQMAGGWIASLNYGYLLPTREPSPWGDDAPEPAVYGQQGWVRWNSGTDTVRAQSQDSRFRASPWQLTRYATPQPGGYGDAALQAMTNFINAIEGIDPPAYSIEQAMLVLDVIEAAYASARENRCVDITSDRATAFAEGR